MQNETADLILKVAHGLIVERGYSAFSYADIAEAVSIRKPSIHHHFPTKANLVVAVLQRHRARLEESLAMMDGRIPNSWERIQKYVGHWETCIRERKEPFCVAALLGAEMPSLPTEVQHEVKTHFEVLQRWLTSTLKLAAKDGSIALKNNAEAEAATLMATVHGAMMSARVMGSSQVYKTIATTALNQLSVA